MKTTKEWIDTLPQDIKEMAYSHTDNFSTKLLKSTLSEAISGAFLWDGTDEGHEFWHLVSEGKFDQARELLPKREALKDVIRQKIRELKHINNGASNVREIWIHGAKWQAERALTNQESAEQIFDRIASNTMARYNPSGFRSKYKTLFKTIILAINEARNQVTN
jgi:hypothetical protein